MRILYIDMDSCRPDHLGCYGYHRDTTPNIDRIAKDASIFNNCYASDTPCLPSRTALLSGQFGFKTGVINHSGEASYLNVPNSGGKHHRESSSLPYVLMENGYHTCFISPFIQRHSAWHTYAGFREVHDTGKHGHEIASETNGWALPWVKSTPRKIIGSCTSTIGIRTAPTARPRNTATPSRTTRRRIGPTRKR